jgi:hypothetical protein
MKHLKIDGEQKESKEFLMMKIPIEKRNEFLSQFTEFEKETFDEMVGSKIEVIEKTYSELLGDLKMEVEMNKENKEIADFIKIDLIGLMTMIFNCINLD